MKAKRLFGIVRCFSLCCLSLVAIGTTISSCEDVVIEQQSLSISLFGDYGRFIVVNESAKDTVYVQDGGGEETMKARAMDLISISFEAKEEYKGQPFTSSYTLYNNTVIEDHLDYQFKLENVEVGELYQVNLWVRPKDVLAFKNGSKINFEIVD